MVVTVGTEGVGVRVGVGVFTPGVGVAVPVGVLVGVGPVEEKVLELKVGR